MAFIRLPVALVGAVIAILAYQLAGNPVGLADGLAWSTLIFTAINLICLWLLSWRARQEGFHQAEVIGFRRQTLLPDLALVLLWSLLLGGLLLAGVLLTVLALHGTSGLVNFQDIFVGEADLSFGIIPLIFVLGSA